ncbi:BlaI/MecI/CopY family transcriptional regulator [Paenibacillus marinisediminis]
MDDKIGRLGDAELEIMLAIWHGDQPVTSNFILDKLQGRRKWALSTLMTSLTRLEKKNFVLCDRSTGTNLYSALINESDYKNKESSTFLERLYDNSFKSLVNSLYSSKAIDKDDLADLRKFLDQMEKGD